MESKTRHAKGPAHEPKLSVTLIDLNYQKIILQLKHNKNFPKFYFRYFRGEFTKSHVSAEKFDKEYVYGIRYNLTFPYHNMASVLTFFIVCNLKKFSSIFFVQLVPLILSSHFTDTSGVHNQFTLNEIYFIS